MEDFKKDPKRTIIVLLILVVVLGGAYRLENIFTSKQDCPYPLLTLKGNSSISGNGEGVHMQVCTIEQQQACKVLLTDEAGINNNIQGIVFEIIDCTKK